MSNPSPLATIRISRTLSQKHVAHILGVAQQTYCKYEVGRLAVPAEYQVRLASLLAVTREELFGDIATTTGE